MIPSYYYSVQLPFDPVSQRGSSQLRNYYAQLRGIWNTDWRTTDTTRQDDRQTDRHTERGKRGETQIIVTRQPKRGG